MKATSYLGLQVPEADFRPQTGRRVHSAKLICQAVCHASSRSSFLQAVRPVWGPPESKNVYHVLDFAPQADCVEKLGMAARSRYPRSRSRDSNATSPSCAASMDAVR